MGGPRSRAAKDDILAAFSTEVTLKAYSAQIGMSPNTLRAIWKESFGVDVFVERGRRLQAAAASKTCLATAKTRKYGETEVPCTTCQQPIKMQTNQAAQLDRAGFVCETCRCDRLCPVCAFPVNGAQGLAMHFRHQRTANDSAHLAYVPEGPWDGKTEGQDFVVCLECRHRAKTLAVHLKAFHGITANDYRAKHGDVLIRCAKTIAAHRDAITAVRSSIAYAGTKTIGCPSCGRGWQSSKFLASMHDHRCADCQQREDLEAEQARWEGKSEPADYVECRVCCWRGENITGHMQGVHPETPLRDYRQAYPDAPLFAEGTMCFPTHKANLTALALDPFKDEKGRVQVAVAAYALGLSWATVLRYCKELGLATRNRLAFQKQVLDGLASLLEGTYEWEWSHPQITNPATGYKLFFDGYYPQHNLLVECQGKQHFEFVSCWHKTQAYFEQMQERDETKLRGALALGYKVLAVRYDEPYTDLAYLRQRLLALGLSV